MVPTVHASMTLLVIYRQCPFSAHPLLVVRYFYDHCWIEEIHLDNMFLILQIVYFGGSFDRGNEGDYGGD